MAQYVAVWQLRDLSHMEGLEGMVRVVSAVTASRVSAKTSSSLPTSAARRIQEDTGDPGEYQRSRRIQERERPMIL